MPGAQELLVIAVVALLVFGPDRLPEVARNAARFIGKLRAAATDSVDELKRAAEVEGLDREWRELSSELRATRDTVTGAARQLGAARTPTPQVPTRADDDPPPVDPEAT